MHKDIKINLIIHRMSILNFMKEVFKNIVIYRIITNVTTENEV